MVSEHLVPQGKHILVKSGDRVRAGDRLVDGPLIPHDILRISGPEKVQHYLLSEIQAVYRSQNVPIDDKHIEILIRQMMRKVQIDDPGDSDLLPTDTIGKSQFQKRNKDLMSTGRRPSTASPMLLGISRASLQSESWISAASFQETTKVLTEAAIAGRRDTLRGLKENVHPRHIIPAGTGFKDYYLSVVKREEPPSWSEARRRNWNSARRIRRSREHRAATTEPRPRGTRSTPVTFAKGQARACPFAFPAIGRRRRRRGRSRH